MAESKGELQHTLNLNTRSHSALNDSGSGVARLLTPDRNNTGAQQTAGEASTDDQFFSRRTENQMGRADRRRASMMTLVHEMFLISA